MLEVFGVKRSRSTIHHLVQKADFERGNDYQPTQIALDETVIKVNGDRFWLFGAVDADTNRILHNRLYPKRTIVITKLFLDELAQMHQIEDAEFLVDGAPWLHAGLEGRGLAFRHETFGERNPVERVFQEIKVRTGQYYHTFIHASVESAEKWLQALAWRYNGLH